MRLERPILCLVTDRRRLAGGDETFETARVRLARLARDAVDAAIDLIQVRERDLETAKLVDLVSDLVDIARGSATRIIVNDRLDVALACGAGGVHLRSDSIAPAAFAASGFDRTPGVSGPPADFLVGRSVHQLAEAVEHAPAVDYLIAGTVFPTISKPAADRLLGESGLSRMAAAVRRPDPGDWRRHPRARAGDCRQRRRRRRGALACSCRRRPRWRGGGGGARAV